MQPVTVSYLWLIPVLPALGAIINGFFGHKLRRSTVATLGCFTVGVSFLLSVYAFWQLTGLVPKRRALITDMYNWIVTGDLNIRIAFVADVLSSVMMLVVTGVGFLIHVYSAGYMAHDKSLSRYFAYLNLFIFSMLLLVMGSNMVLMFVGWEGVGACSYLLIGFWFDKTANAVAGRKAFIVNRIGDAGFLLGMFAIFASARTLEFNAIYELLAVRNIQVPVTVAMVVSLLLFIGAAGKSAQIPLYIWLPDAMAGPTPVSALIHAATMVTAGVYMIARLFPIFLISATALHIIAWVGAITALLAATIALVQNDIKKVLAYSTVSQLGYMFLAMGVGAFTAGMFHLVTHAFFKGLLFLGAGAVIHAMEKANAADDPQDIRSMGGLRKKLPLTYWTFVAAAVAIAGMPFTSGFFSKDEIIWKSYATIFGSPALALVGLAAAGMTSFYMFRLVFMTFHGEYRGARGTFDRLHDSDWRMSMPLVVLAILALFGGFLGVSPLLGHVLHIPNFFEEWLHPWFRYANVPIVIHGDTMEILMMLTSVALAFFGWYLAWYLYLRKNRAGGPLQLPAILRPVHNLLLNKYWVDEIYDYVIVRPLHAFSRVFLYLFIDRKIIDLAVHGVAGAVRGVGELIRPLQAGTVASYLLWLLSAVAAYLLWAM